MVLRSMTEIFCVRLDLDPLRVRDRDLLSMDCLDFDLDPRDFLPLDHDLELLLIVTDCDLDLDLVDNHLELDLCSST